MLVELVSAKGLVSLVVGTALVSVTGAEVALLAPPTGVVKVSVALVLVAGTASSAPLVDSPAAADSPPTVPAAVCAADVAESEDESQLPNSPQRNWRSARCAACGGGSVGVEGGRAAGRAETERETRHRTARAAAVRGRAMLRGFEAGAESRRGWGEARREGRGSDGPRSLVRRRRRRRALEEAGQGARTCSVRAQLCVIDEHQTGACTCDAGWRTGLGPADARSGSTRLVRFAQLRPRGGRRQHARRTRVFPDASGALM